MASARPYLVQDPPPAPASIAHAINIHRDAWDTLVHVATGALKVHPPAAGDARRRGARNTYDALTDALMRTPIGTVSELKLFGRYVASLRAHGGSAWPVGYPLQVWHLTAAVETIDEAIARLVPST